MPALAQWEFSNDRAETERAYSQAQQGGAEACGCETCRNYAAARDRVLPESFVSFLRSLGVDPSKEGEAYHMAQVAPGKHHYGGWYHFVGDLEKTGDFPMIEAAPGFKYFLCRAHAPHLKPLDGLNLVEVGFEAEAVPWVINEIEPQ